MNIACWYLEDKGVGFMGDNSNNLLTPKTTCRGENKMLQSGGHQPVVHRKIWTLFVFLLMKNKNNILWNHYIYEISVFFINKKQKQYSMKFIIFMKYYLYFLLIKTKFYEIIIFMKF